MDSTVSRERRNLVSARVPSHFKRSRPQLRTSRDSNNHLLLLLIMSVYLGKQYVLSLQIFSEFWLSILETSVSSSSTNFVHRDRGRGESGRGEGGERVGEEGGEIGEKREAREGRGDG